MVRLISFQLSEIMAILSWISRSFSLSVFLEPVHSLGLNVGELQGYLRIGVFAKVYIDVISWRYRTKCPRRTPIHLPADVSCKEHFVQVGCVAHAK